MTWTYPRETQKYVAPGFDEARGGAQVLNLPRIRRRGDQRRESSHRIGVVHIGEQVDAVAHADPLVYAVGDSEPRPAQVAVCAAGVLRAVEGAIDAGHSLTLR